MVASASRQLLPRLSRAAAVPRVVARAPAPRALARHLHTTSIRPAVILPIIAQGPPPKAPIPFVSPLAEYRTRQKAAANAQKKRFWKEVHVVETTDGFTINLDKRPLKTPQKALLVIPKTKPLLASAIAVEWSHLRSASDAAKLHRIPLTQMASRALDMAAAEKVGDFSTREAAVANLIRYIDTDTVLCIAPTTPEHLQDTSRGPQLRELQLAAADEIRARVFPGLELRIVDGDEGIVGSGQPRETREALLGWMRGLDVWTLVGLERIVHATKSFLIGARMVVDKEGWGVEEAAEVASIEVRYQTRQWGEVEDTHDVEKEDLGRQIGAGWLLIAGGP